MNRDVLSQIVNSSTVTIPCTAPSPPRDLKVEAPVLVRFNNRKMWRYVISWKEPKNINCASLHDYPYDVSYPSPTSAVHAVSSNMTVIEAEVNRNVTFRVWAINNQAKKSMPVNVAFQTPLADKPQQPTDLFLEAINSSCVRLNWSFTQQNKVVDGFQV
ncbi:hypothetical protein EB796_024105 [Bugula neritina]|uniref:Fibronectin type-III domain-containing protein n=1 Tax=Bugula neritina TaxID=10212 RepID=A0A7J7IW35_BUGNE|nr:hypothetical protein EB796_024105 [Bugula neritina]